MSFFFLPAALGIWHKNKDRDGSLHYKAKIKVFPELQPEPVHFLQVSNTDSEGLRVTVKRSNPGESDICHYLTEHFT